MRPAFRWLFLAALFGWLANASGETLHGIDNPLHGYFTRAPHDRFSALEAELRTGPAGLDASSELPLLLSVLNRLQVPVSSQMLVYSVTSLQKALISPRRPRALFFNDDTYVGFVPDGRMEIISTDPDLGCIYYIFDRYTGRIPRVVRSTECANCHSPHYLENIPALALESVVPGLTGGGERAFRRQQSGDGVPLELRFGGWHVTGAGPGFPLRWANRLIEYHQGQAVERPIALGELFDVSRYPLPSSDLLPQLLQEHQVGFVNRALLAAYRAREALAAGQSEMAELARPLVRYLFFANEVPLPTGGVEGDPEYKDAFLINRRAASNGAALKTFDLQTRLFRYRCSYMVYTPVFAGLPSALKQEVFGQMRQVLSGADPEFQYLSSEERKTIAAILAETLPGYATGG